MNTPKQMPKADPMMPEMTVLTAQLLIMSSCTSCSGEGGSILAYSFLFGTLAPCWFPFEADSTLGPSAFPTSLRSPSGMVIGHRINAGPEQQMQQKFHFGPC